MKNEQANLVVSEINKMTPAQLVEDTRVQCKFVQLYNNIHGQKTGELIYHKEKFNFLRLLQERPDLRECTQLSLYGAFLDAAVCGLSLEQGSRPHAYVIPRPINIGTRENPKWEKRVSLQISPYGELVMRMRAGQIKSADSPIIVYDGDTFIPEATEAGKKVTYKALIPRKSNTIIGAFIRIIKPDGSVDFYWMLKEDIERLQGYSEKQNKGKANALYSSNSGQIDTGFLEAKVIKHAFDTYPKVRTGDFTELVTQDPELKVDYEITDDLPDSFDQGKVVTPEVTEVHDDDEVF